MTVPVTTQADQIPTTVPQTELDQLRARYIETSDRSWLNERLAVRNLPAHLHGEWIGTDDMSQYNAKNRGFVDGKQYLTPDNIMHYTPEGGVIGDVKFMVMSKAHFNVMKEVDAERAAKQGGLDREIHGRDENARRMGLGVDRGDAVTTTIVTGEDVDQLIKH